MHTITKAETDPTAAFIHAAEEAVLTFDLHSLISVHALVTGECRAPHSIRCRAAPPRLPATTQLTIGLQLQATPETRPDLSCLPVLDEETARFLDDFLGLV